MKPTAPYYAVIFTSARADDGDKGYAKMADRMEALAKRQPGFLGSESAREDLGITVSYWESRRAIADWKANAEHLFAQQKGAGEWYRWYKVRICFVEREYGWNDRSLEQD